MRKCIFCGNQFDVVNTQNDFDYVTGLSYLNIKPDLCFSCAVEAVESEMEGVYFEACDCCGEKFDLFEAEKRFVDSQATFEDETLIEQWRPLILCCDCALKKLCEKQSKY